MSMILDGTSGLTTPGVVNTAGETIATTLAVTGASTLTGAVTASTTLAVTGVSTFAAGTALLPALTTTGDTNTGLWFPAADTIAASTGGTERMRIDSSGNVLVNTTSAFDSGKLCIDGGNNAFAPITCKVTQTTNSTQIGFRNGNGIVGGIATNGSTTTYATSSDYRLKENVLPMVGALDKVALLKPVTYKWKVDGSDGQGFIAHELQAVVSGCVTGEKDAVENYIDEEGNEQTRIKPQGIDTSFLVATLTAAIQELKAIVDAQAVRIAALES